MIETLFVLYLVLSEKPRFDDTNVVAVLRDEETCDISAKNFNENYEYLWPDKNHSMVYVCKKVDEAKQ